MAKKKKLQENAEPVTIGFDSEWVTKEIDKRIFNEILSYQFFGIDGPRSWKKVFHVYRNMRISLSGLLSRFFEQGIDEGALEGWPKRIYLVAHWALGDLMALSDFHSKIKYLFEPVQKTLVTLGRPSQLAVYDRNRNKHSCNVTLVDTLLLAPKGKSKLSDLGELVQVPKIILPAGAIERMDLLRQNNPQLFDRYGLGDPETSAKYFLYMKGWTAKNTCQKKIPKTIGGLSTSFCQTVWKEQSMDYPKIFGLEQSNEEKWDPQKKRSTKTTKTVISFARLCNESFAREAYYGGRNETYIYGTSHHDKWTDWDISSAYTTAMSVLGSPDYENSLQTKNLEDFQPDTLGFADVEFEFPKDTRFPCLPVRASNGLVFPLRGRTICPSPEIYLAESMGALIRIRQGIVIPTNFEIKPFFEVMSEIQKRRKNLPKGSLDELLIKDMGNSLYGKTAQGLGPKRVFDNKDEESKKVKPSKITNPYFASYTTSLIRATLSEILTSLSNSTTVISATTDGFITNATDEEIENATQGPICKLLKRTKYNLVGDKKILEKKHVVTGRLFSWRTRGQATLEKKPEEKTILAQAGLKPPEDVDPNQWIIEKFETRTPETSQEIRCFRSLRDIYKDGGDFVKTPIQRKIRMDWDWKRKPINIEMRKVVTEEHLYFDTEPWKNIEEYNEHRTEWKKYQKHNAGILKTLEDLKKFEDYKGSVQATKKGLRRAKKEGSLKIAIRQFLRAYVRQEMGLTNEMSYPTLLKWMHEGGYKQCKLSTIKDSKRERLKLEHNSVPDTPETKTFFQYVKNKFPNFTPENLLTKS